MFINLQDNTIFAKLNGLDKLKFSATSKLVKFSHTKHYIITALTIHMFPNFFGESGSF